MQIKIIEFLKYFLIFGTIFFLVSYFVPAFRKDKELIEILIRTIVASLIYALIMPWINKRKNEKK